MQRYFVTGTDTDVGKTVACAWLCHHLQADYWKPVQSGAPLDVDEIARLCPAVRVHESVHVLSQPLSPHEAAKRDGVEIDLADFALPATDKPLIVEGAGGVMVPLNDSAFVADLMVRLALPAIVVVRSGLGTINHTLLTVAALRQRGVSIKGLIMVGEKMPHNRQALEQFTALPIIAELPVWRQLGARAFDEVQPEIVL